jgi:hypothetical protein
MAAIKGRSAANHAKREEWKAKGGRWDHQAFLTGEQVRYTNQMLLQKLKAKNW